MSRMVVAATGAATTIVVARVLGASGSGAYAVAQNMVLLLTIGGALGLQQGIAYLVSSGRWSPRPAYAASLRAAFVIGTVCCIVALLARIVAPRAFAGLDVWVVAVAAGSLPFALVVLYVASVALAIDRYEAYVLPPAAQSTLALAFVIPAAVVFDIEGAVAALAASSVVVALGSIWWGRSRLPRAATPAQPRMLRRALGFGLQGYAATALQQVNLRIDLFILSAFASSEAVGHYAVAFAVTSVLWLLPQALSEVLFPRVAHLSASAGNDAEEHRAMVEVKALRHVTITLGLMALVVAAALLVLVVPVYGEQFRPAIDLGLILLPGVAAIGISGVLAATIVGRGKPIYSLYVVLITTPLTLILYGTLIPPFEATGAAWASTASYVATLVLVSVFYRRITGRAVAPCLRPTRSEWEDLRALPRAARARLRGAR